MNSRQTRKGTGKAGMGVDATGGPVVDPTENVLALVDVEKAHAKELREADTKRQDDLRDADQRRQDELRDAGDKHRKEVADLKQGYDKQISDILTVQVKTTSELISTQLDKVTTSLSNQINNAALQQSGLMTTLSERIGRLEQSQWQTTGKTSVSDPATADALTKMAQAVQGLTMAEKKTEGHGLGQREIIAWLIAAGVALMAFLKH